MNVVVVDSLSLVAMVVVTAAGDWQVLHTQSI